MLISKNLFCHFSHSRVPSYSLILTAVIVLLSMVGCNACGDAFVEGEYATNLHVTLTPLNLQDSQREVVLTLVTAGKEKEVARFKDFNIRLQVSAVGKELGNSQINFEGYDKSSKKVPRSIQLANKSLKPLEGSLYDFLKGGEGASLEYKQDEQVKFFFLPDMQSEVESMEIKITVINNVTHQEIFNGTSGWERSPYEFKIIGLDQSGALQNNTPCTLQVARKDKQAITENELNNLYVAVGQDIQLSEAPHLLGVKDKLLTFQPTDLQGALILKQLIVVPGTIQQMVIFTLSLYQNNEAEAAAITKAKYHPVVLPYKFEVDKNELIGPNDTEFEVTIQEPAGKVLDVAQLQKLTLSVERQDGTHSLIQGKKAPNFEVKGSEFLMGADSKSATQTFSIDTKADTQSVFKLSLLNDQGVAVANEQLVSWCLGVESKIVYNPGKNQFEFNVSNTTTDPAKITLHWENVTRGEGKSNGVKIDGQETGQHDVNLVGRGRQTENLAVDWRNIISGMGASHEAKFKLTVKLNDAVVIMEPYDELIRQEAPKVTIAAKNAKVDYQGDLEKEVVFVLTATDKDINRPDFRNLAISLDTANKMGTLKTVGGKDVNGLSLDQILANSVQKLTKNIGQEFTLKIDNQNSQEVTFTHIYLKGSHDAQDGAIPRITWEKDSKDVKIKISPLRGTTNNMGVLVVDSTKEFAVKLENNSGFLLDKALLQNIIMQADAIINTKEPDQVVCQGIDLKAGPTLWDVLQAQPAPCQDLKSNDSLQLSFSIKPGSKKLIEFEMSLVDNTTTTILSTQQVRWGSLICFVDENQVTQLNIDQARIDSRDKKPKLSLPVKLRNISGAPIQAEDLKNIKVVLLQTAEDLKNGNVLEYGEVTIGTIRGGKNVARRNAKSGEVLNLISQFESDKGKLTTDTNDLKSLLEGSALGGGAFGKDGEVSLNLKVDVSKCQETDKLLKGKGESREKRYVRFRLMGQGNTIMSEQRIEIAPSLS